MCGSYFTVLFVILVAISIACGVLFNKADNRLFEIKKTINWMDFWPLFAIYKTKNLTEKQNYDRKIVMKEFYLLFISVNILKIYFILILPLWLFLCAVG